MTTLSPCAVNPLPGLSTFTFRPIFRPIVWSFLLFIFLLGSTAASAGQITLAWNANNESYLAGYKLYYGASSRAYDHSVDVGNVTTHSVTPLSGVQAMFFAVTVYDINGHESGFSEEVSWTASLAQHTITAAAGAGGSISPSGSISVLSGESRSFAISPASGYSIQNVLVNGVSVGTPSSYTFTNVTSDQSISASFSQLIQYGSLTVTINPSEARTAGAKWRVDGGTWRNSGETVSNLPTGAYAVQFSAISGWNKPADQSVAVSHNATATASGIYISVEPPVAVIQPESVSGNTSSAVTLDGSGSFDPAGGNIVSWQWQMGDGTSKTGALISHKYIVTGTYTASLTVSNEQGLTAKTSVPVTIKSSQGGVESFLRAIIRALMRRGSSSLDVSFSGDLSEAPEGGEIVSYEWFFGDGATAEGLVVSHTYLREGKYTVVLRVTDSFGETDTATETFRLGQQPINLVPILNLLLLDD